jgi:ABC-type lipoprotein export system ATPase subunit
MVAVMGPSGCGKSTLLKIIGALDSPTRGEVLIAGRNIRSYRPSHAFRRDYIGFVFQFHHLIPSMSLLENVEIPLLTVALSRRERRERAAYLLDQMGLADRMHFLPTRVSGGERQRAAIARALANHPRILLADEPTGNVDTATGEKVVDFMIVACRERGMTLILATHNREIAEKMDAGIHLRNGTRLASRYTAPSLAAGSCI